MSHTSTPTSNEQEHKFTVEYDKILSALNWDAVCYDQPDTISVAELHLLVREPLRVLDAVNRFSQSLNLEGLLGETTRGALCRSRSDLKAAAKLLIPETDTLKTKRETLVSQLMTAIDNDLANGIFVNEDVCRSCSKDTQKLARELLDLPRDQSDLALSAYSLLGNYQSVSHRAGSRASRSLDEGDVGAQKNSMRDALTLLRQSSTSIPTRPPSDRPCDNYKTMSDILTDLIANWMPNKRQEQSMTDADWDHLARMCSHRTDCLVSDFKKRMRLRECADTKETSESGSIGGILNKVIGRGWRSERC